MPFYRVKDGGGWTLRLSVENPDKKYHSRYVIVGHENTTTVSRMVLGGTIGLFLGDGEMYRIQDSPIEVISMPILLIGEQRLYFYWPNITLISEEEIESLLR